MKVRRGRFLTPTDLATTANVAVLAAGAAERMYSYEDPLGRPLLLGNGAYVVVGVLEPQDSGSAVPGAVSPLDLNNDIYIPLTSARSRFGELQMILRSGGRDFEKTQLSEITLTLHDENLVSADGRHGPQTAGAAASETRNDFEIQVPLELLRQAEREKRIWNLVLGSIAGISLLVGGIGIMNIMLATVSERTKEIGIRRALGATRSHIVTQFMVESMVLAAGGGLLGIFLGVAIPLGVSRLSEIETAHQLVGDHHRLQHVGADRRRLRRLPRPPRRDDGSHRSPAARVDFREPGRRTAEGRPEQVRAVPALAAARR